MPNSIFPLRFGAIVVAALLAGCGAAEQPKAASTPAPKAVVKNDGYFEPVLNMTIDFGPDAPREGKLLERAGDEVIAIGKAMTEGKPPVAGKIDVINFTVLGPSGPITDVGRKIAHFTFDGQELRQLAHMGAKSEAMMDSAKEFGSWTPANDDVVRSYCGDHPSATLCSR